MGAGSDIKAFFVDNIWATILIAVGVVLIIVVLVWYFLRRRKRQGYVSLESGRDAAGISVQTFLMAETMRKTHDETQAELLSCQYYLRSHSEFELDSPLGPIGSRLNKAWFSVRHKRQYKIMYTLPRAKRCCFPFDKSTQKTLRQMFHILHHPYLLPVHHIGFIAGQDTAVVVQPFSMKGSLKDLIYRSNPLQPWDRKYRQRRSSLLPKRIALIGRQVLEGLEYLTNQGIYHNNVHSGNIIMVNNVPKLTGFEVTLLGHHSRLAPQMKSFMPKNAHRDTRNVIGVGHILFEMAAGYEPLKVRPTVREIKTRCDLSVAEALAHIFYNPEDRIPTCLEVKSHPLFARIQAHELPEMQSFRAKPFVLRSKMKKLLAAVANNQPLKPRGKKRRVTKETAFTSPSASTSASPQKSTSTAASSAATPRPRPSSQPTPSQPQQSQQQQQQQQQPQRQQRQQQRQKGGGSSSVRAAPPPSSEGRGALLSSIRQGKSLRKAKTNDRSAPKI